MTKKVTNPEIYALVRLWERTRPKDYTYFDEAFFCQVHGLDVQWVREVDRHGGHEWEMRFWKGADLERWQEAQAMAEAARALAI